MYVTDVIHATNNDSHVQFLHTNKVTAPEAGLNIRFLESTWIRPVNNAI